MIVAKHLCDRGAAQRALRLAPGGRDPAIVSLRASALDLPGTAALVDPVPLLPAELGAVVTDPAALFPAGPNGLPSVPGVSARDRKEYVATVARQVQAGLVQLALTAVSGAPFLRAVRIQRKTTTHFQWK